MPRALLITRTPLLPCTYLTASAESRLAPVGRETICRCRSTKEKSADTRRRCKVITYHHPYCEQQFPYVLPLHVYPVVPAQVPSALTFSVLFAVALLVVLVLVFLVVDVLAVVGFVDVEDDLLDLVEVLTELDDELEPQEPPTGLHPVPQYVEVEPQYPYWLQQFPKVEPMQVMVVPHVPSVEMACVALEVLDDVDEEVFDMLEVVFPVVDVVVTLVELEVVLVDEVDLIGGEELLVDVQFPEAGRHPAPQYLM